MTAAQFYVSPVYAGLLLVVPALYLWLSWRTASALQRQIPGPRELRWLVPIAVLLHAGLLFHAVVGQGSMRFGFAPALSGTLWLAVAVIWIEGLLVPIRGLLVLVLPVAALSAVLPAVFTGAPISVASDTVALRVHLLVAISSFSLFTIAAMHAVLMASMDRHLHAAGRATDSFAARLFAEIPPLLEMERLLFRLIGAGFLLLTGTLISGVLFSEQLFGRALRFDHKTVFTIAAWVLFAGLLGGRQMFGWRGRIALRWTLVGFVLLLLAYVGSRFVLEVILKRM